MPISLDRTFCGDWERDCAASRADARATGRIRSGERSIISIPDPAAIHVTKTLTAQGKSQDTCHFRISAALSSAVLPIRATSNRRSHFPRLFLPMPQNPFRGLLHSAIAGNSACRWKKRLDPSPPYKSISPLQQAAALKSYALARGLTVEQCVMQLVEQSAHLAENSAPFDQEPVRDLKRPIWEVIAERVQALPWRGVGASARRRREPA